MFFQPLEQFEIYIIDSFFFRILNFVFSFWNGPNYFFFTNSLLYIIFSFLTLYVFFFLSRLKIKLLPDTGWEFLLESLYFMVYNMVYDQLNGHYRLGFYFPLLFSVFLFILISNIIGLTPYSFTNTAFLMQTFSISCTFLIGITIAGFFQQGPSFFHLFMPQGVPVFLVPLLSFIELVSYTSRSFSLAIRLFANMMSGHSLLNILAGFSLSLSKKSLFFGLFPFLLVLSITFLELGIALLQGYVFVVLLCIYLNDALYDAHETH